jgi:hypothetical protein
MFGPGTLDSGSKRRSIYFTVKRSNIVPAMQVFDAPDALSSLGERPTTTIAPQALMLMNNPQVRSAARNFARKLLESPRVSVEQAVRTGYQIALGRSPGEAELADLTAFVWRQMDSYRATSKDDGRELALADFCQMLMCLNEFVYVE